MESGHLRIYQQKSNENFGTADNSGVNARSNQKMKFWDYSKGNLTIS
jgi:hypothetical protein